MAKVNDDRLIMRVPRGAALITIAALNIAAVAACFAASYLGNFQWAMGHGLAGWRAYAFPLAIDTVLAIGELILFVYVLDGFDDVWLFSLGAAFVAAGLTASVAGNAFHSAAADPLDRLTWSAFPITAAVALAGGLLLLKRITAQALSATVSTAATQDDTRTGPRRQPRPGVKAAVTPARRPLRRAGPNSAEARAARAARLAELGPAARNHLAGLPAAHLPSVRAFALSHCGGDRRMAADLLGQRKEQPA